MGRTRTFDRTLTLEKAMGFFQVHGYEAASLSGLLETMNISRGSFYQCFGSKEALFEECLNTYQGKHFQEMEDLLNTSLSSYDFIKAFYEEATTEEGRQKWQNGCLLVNCVAESPQLPNQCRENAQNGLTYAKSIFKKVADKAAAEGSLQNGTTPEQLAAYLYNTAIGLKTQLRAGSSLQELKYTVELVLATLPVRNKNA